MPNKVQTLMDLYFSPGQASRICGRSPPRGQRLRPASRLGPPQSRARVEESMLPARAAGARRSAYVLRALACSTSVMLSTGCSPSRSLSLSWTPVVSRRRRERLEGVSPSPRPAGYDTVYKRFAHGLGSDSWQPPADSPRTLCLGEGVAVFPAPVP